jgi:lipoate-protein ligase A
VDVLVEHRPGNDPVANLALEEALVRAAPERALLRIWQNSTCVVVGRGQRVEREVDLAACRRNGVPVLRRSSGGGTVYHALGNLNVTLVASGRRPDLLNELARLLTDAIGQLGLEATTGERGVSVGPRKVSGLAMQVTGTGTLAHATLLVTTRAALVGAYLLAAPPDPHPLDSRRAPVAPLRAHQPTIDIASATAAVRLVAAAYDGPLRPRPVRAAERYWQARLLHERYDDPSWHLTGHPREASWTTRPASTSTA